VLRRFQAKEAICVKNADYYYVCARFQTFPKHKPTFLCFSHASLAHEFMSEDDLFRAAQRGKVDTTIQLLQQLLQEDAPGIVFVLAMEVAIWNDHGDIVREIARLAGHMRANCVRHLMTAARRDSPAAVRALIQCGTHATGSNIFMSKALRQAAQNGNAATTALLMKFVTSNVDRTSALVMAAASGGERVVRTLIRGRVDVNATELNGGRALHYAAHKGATRVVKQLIWCKAHVHTPTYSALGIAMNREHAATAAVLRRFGASLSIAPDVE